VNVIASSGKKQVQAQDDTLKLYMPCTLLYAPFSEFSLQLFSQTLASWFHLDLDEDDQELCLAFCWPLECVKTG